MICRGATCLGGRRQRLSKREREVTVYCRGMTAPDRRAPSRGLTQATTPSLRRYKYSLSAVRISNELYYFGS